MEIYESLRPQHQNYLIKIDFIPRRRRIDRYIDIYLGNSVFSGDTFFFSVRRSNVLRGQPFDDDCVLSDVCGYVRGVVVGYWTF